MHDLEPSPDEGGETKDEDVKDEESEEDEDAFGTFDELEEQAQDKTSTAQKLLTVLTNDLPLCHNREKTDELVRRIVDLHVR